MSSAASPAPAAAAPDAPAADRPDHRRPLGVRVDVTGYADSADRIFRWAAAGESRYCCFCTVHMVMESHDDAAFRAILDDADMVHPDGMPLVWMQKLLGAKDAARVTAPDQTLALCERAAREGVPVGFYGASPKTIEDLTANMKARYPGLNVAYALSPPFRPLTDEEDARITADIAASGCRILFMGLGCPKQERWMQAHRGRIPCVALGVGATFDWHAGGVKRAPQWLQDLGLEWAFRLTCEPKRLWKRYLTTNPRFLALCAMQLLGLRKYWSHRP